MKNPSLKLFLFFLLFALFSVNGTVQAASMTVTWTSPRSYDVTNNPTVYKRGDTITFEGKISATGCSNSFNLPVTFFIEKISGVSPTSGGTKQNYKLVDGTLVAINAGQQSTFSVTTTIPNDAYLGINIVHMVYYSQMWGGVAFGGTDIERQIRISENPTTPLVGIYPTSPLASDSLNCYVASISTTADPYNACTNPLVCDGSSYVSPMLYTYKWYKSGALYYTSAETTGVTSILITPPAGSWYCCATPRGRTGLTGVAGCSSAVSKP